MPSKKPAPIDLFTEALAVNIGEPVAVALFGIDFQVRRDYTGDDVAAYIELFNTAAKTTTIEEQMIDQLDMLTNLTEQDRDVIVDKLMNMTFTAASSIMVRIGQIAGLRGEDTGFLTGTLR